MSDIWLASLNADGIAVTGHSPNPVFDGFAVLAARIFVANDGTSAGPGFPTNSVHSFAILAGIEDNFYGGGPTYEWQSYYRFLQKPFPSNPFDQWKDILQPNVIPSPTVWTPITQIEANGNNGSSYFGGGSLSIQKDFGSSQYVFTTPMGAVTVPFNWLDNQPPISHPFWVPTDTPLMAVGFGMALGYDDSSVGNSSQVNWFNFYSRKNGVIIDGAALSAVDPGSWDPAFTLEWSLPPGGGSYHQTGVLLPSSSSQQATRYRTLFSVPPAGTVYDATHEERYIAPTGMTGSRLDLAAMPEHDIVFGAWRPMPTWAAVRRGHDHGHTWAETIIETSVVANSLSVQCYAGTVYVCYYDGTHVVVQRSADLGITWSAAVPVSITGTNPRLVIAPDGTFFYFYFSGTTLVLSRSADLGATLLDATPIPITASLTAQDFGAVLAADRSLVVSYIKAGNWENKRSLDWGSSWSLA